MRFICATIIILFSQCRTQATKLEICEPSFELFKVYHTTSGDLSFFFVLPQKARNNGIIVLDSSFSKIETTKEWTLIFLKDTIQDSFFNIDLLSDQQLESNRAIQLRPKRKIIGFLLNLKKSELVTEIEYVSLNYGVLCNGVVKKKKQVFRVSDTIYSTDTVVHNRLIENSYR